MDNEYIPNLIIKLVVQNFMYTPDLMHYIDSKTLKSLFLVSKTVYNLLCQIPPFNKLMPHQYFHFINLALIINKYSVGIDTSDMGRGKTSCAVAIDMMMGFDKCVVYGPTRANRAWMKAQKHFNVPRGKEIEIHSYDEFRCKVKPYLKLIPELEDRPTGEYDDILKNNLVYNICEKKSYQTINDDWLSLISKYRVLLVFDEMHHLKNDTNQSNMCAVLSQSLLQHKQNKVLCLSATPFDKREHTQRICRILGILKQDELAVNTFNNYQITGYNDVVEFCTNTLKSKMAYNEIHINGDANVKLYQMWLKYIVHNISCSMPPPRASQFNLYCVNYFSDVNDPEDIALIKMGCNQISNSLIAIATNQQPGNNMANIANISKGMSTIELGKVNDFARHVRNHLMVNPNRKVVVMLNYVKPIRKLAKLLQAYNPMLILGGVSEEKRVTYLDRFQQPNNTYRLLITNISTTNECIDLDDQYGGFQRDMFISPSYHLIRQHQASKRIFRSMTMSDAYVYYFYAKCCRHEVSLLKRVKEKSNIVKDNLDYKADMPGDYLTYDE
jgi:hypothetical protein